MITQQQVSNQSQLIMITHPKYNQIPPIKFIQTTIGLEVLNKVFNNQQPQEKEIQKITHSSNFIEKKLPKEMKSFLKQKRIMSEISLNESKLTSSTNRQSINHQENLNSTNQTIIQPEHNNQMTQVIAKHKKIAHSKISHLIIHSQISSQCQICEGRIETQMIKNKVFDCLHVFCSDCTKNYILYKINRFEEICCPNQNCKEALNIKSIFYSNEISLKERKKYLLIHNFYQIHNKNQLKKICPTQECQGIIEVDPSKSSVNCNICKNQFCSKCFALSHPDQCEDFETMFLKDNFNLVQCEKCKNFIEKTQGCHHISCKCGYQFCQKCKEKWSKRHICKYSILNKASQGWGGCDWGITKKDHINFLLKIPLKAMLILLFTSFWILFSFLGVPLNICMAIYWLYLLLIKPSINIIKNEVQIWKILVYLILFPLLMIWNIPQGKQYLVTHLDNLLPQISNSFRWIIRL